MEVVMRKFALMIGTATAIVVGGSASSLAVPLILDSGVRGAIADINLIEKTQYVWRGRRYCWYGNGWFGPGWYWCGYNWRRGYGWGGPYGWRGWHYPGWHRVPPRHYRYYYR